MSRDFTVVDDQNKTYWHLGQRMADMYSFGWGSTDFQGRLGAAKLIHDNVGVGKSLRIVITDEIPSGYTELDICEEYKLYMEGTDDVH